MKTPVVKWSRRRKKPDRDSDTCNSSSDTSESELNVSCSRMVQYSVPEGIPGVSIHPAKKCHLETYYAYAEPCFLEN